MITLINHKNKTQQTFLTMTSLRLLFSLHFYFNSIVFLIFDVELILIHPFIFCFKLFNIINIFLMINGGNGICLPPCIDEASFQLHGGNLADENITVEIKNRELSNLPE